MLFLNTSKHRNLLAYEDFESGFTPCILDESHNYADCFITCYKSATRRHQLLDGIDDGSVCNSFCGISPNDVAENSLSSMAKGIAWNSVGGESKLSGKTIYHGTRNSERRKWLKAMRVQEINKPAPEPNPFAPETCVFPLKIN